MGPITIRHSEASDIDAIKAIYDEHSVMAGTLQVPFPSRAHWQPRLTDLPPGTYHLVAICDNEVAGHLALKCEQSPRRRHVGSFGISVRTACQGQGVGSALLAAAVDMADNWLALLRIEITVYADNEAAVALYEKHGFVVEGEAPMFAFRNGAYVAALHMARIRSQT